MNRGRVLLGSWRCSSGNGIDAYLVPADRDGRRLLELHWDDPPPLREPDQRDYDTRILPAVIRRAQEYLEHGGAVVVVRL